MNVRQLKVIKIEGTRTVLIPKISKGLYTLFSVFEEVILYTSQPNVDQPTARNNALKGSMSV